MYKITAKNKKHPTNGGRRGIWTSDLVIISDAL